MSERASSVAVLVSAGRHPVSGLPRPCRGDAVAMALGMRLAVDHLRIIHAGDLNELALKDYLALGGRSIEVIGVQPGSDVLAPLAATVAEVDLILTGSQSEQGAGSGLLPYALAHRLNRPIVGDVLDAQFEERQIRVRQFLPQGRRRGVLAPLPAVLTVHPLAPVELRYAYARRVSGHIEACDGAALANSAMPTEKPEFLHRQPRRLKAEDKSKPAHARLLSAIETEAKGGVVAIEGSCVDKAQVMLSFLREHRLVDF